MNEAKDFFPKRPWYKKPWLLILIVLLIIVVVIVFVMNYLPKTQITLPQQPAPVKKVLTEEERADIIKQLSANPSTTTPDVTPVVVDKKKADIIKQLSAPSSETAPKVSDAERQKIINSLSN